MNVVRFQQPTYPFFVNNLFNELFSEQQKSAGKREASCSPFVNIKENDEAFEVEFSVPGYKKEQFTIRNNKGILTVKAEVENEQKTTGYQRKEFSVLPFERSFKLPDNVLVESISAKLENGILIVGIPKNKEVDQKKEFNIAIE